MIILRDKLVQCVETGVSVGFRPTTYVSLYHMCVVPRIVTKLYRYNHEYGSYRTPVHIWNALPQMCTSLEIVSIYELKFTDWSL